MEALSRRCLLGFALLGFGLGSALALPTPSRPHTAKTAKTAKAAANPPNSGHHPPVAPPGAKPPYAGPPAVAQVHAVRTPPLRKMKVIPPPFRGEDEDVEPVHPQRPTDSPTEDGRRQNVMGPARSAPVSTGLSFEGIGTGLPGFVPCCTPPDVNGHVGATQYVQWNNLSFAIWDKNGNKLFGPAAGSTLFQPLGGVCASHNDGDPVVNYDVLAGRWILSQFAIFASPGFSHQCVAVSLTSDATGAWYLYDFTLDAVNFVDYPHMAVWPDGYYMAAHVFDSSGTSYLAGRIYAFERDKMLNGQPARMLSKDLKQYGGRPQYGFLAADLGSILPPPAGEAEFVLGPDPVSTTLLDSARVAVTWGASPSMSLTETQISANWGIPPCVNNTNGRDCVPQPPPASGYDDLDSLDQHFMHRLDYRNFGGSPVQESLVANITVPGSASTPPHGAIRWFEFRNAGDSSATPTVYQAATFDPDSDYRWMGSIAMDKDHDIALGYSRSSTTTKPSIYVNGRLGTDPLNTLGTETQMMAGAGVQFAPNRWGDYSSMTLDPIDQCTFWYTNEYLRANGNFNWATRIGSFKFPSCAPLSWGNVTGTVTSCATGAPIGGVTVSVGDGYRAISDSTGHYSIAAPAGTYTVTAAGDDINCSAASPATVSVIVPADGTTSQDFCMTGTSKLEFGTATISDTANGNGNGILNRNECVDLNVALANNGCARESAISATLSTSTAEVTVTQGSSFYPDLNAGASGTNSVPFKFNTSANFVCGTDISFTLNLTYAGGSKSVSFTVPTCSGAAATFGPTSIGTSDPAQGNRLFRDGLPSDCGGKTCAGPFGGGTYNYKTFKFNNGSATTSCITVTMNADCAGGGEVVEAVAYLGSTYTPPDATGSTICNNYLGDAGISIGGTVTSVSFSFNVPAHSDFIIVTNTVLAGQSCPQFSGTISGLIDNTPGPGPCPTCTPPATPTVSAGGATTFCAGGSVTLNSSAATGNQWYLNGAAIPGATGTSQIATAGGAYTVTTTNNGCTSAPSTAVSVTVNPTPATPAPSNSGPFCAGSTIALATPTVANATYAWTGPNGFTSTLQNPTKANATAADAGAYSVIVTVNGCSSAAGTTSVAVTPLPATPSPSNSGPFCTGQIIALSTATVSGASYHWTGPNGFTSTLQNPTKTNATAADAGTYFVTVTVNGCTSAGGTTQVAVNPIPATPSASNSGPFCAGSTISLSTPTVANATYAWTGPNGFTSALQNPTKANAAAADAGTYSVTITVGGCTSAAGTTSVTVNTAVPATPTASNGGPFCEGSTISLSTPTVASATYAWTGPNGFTSSQQNPTKINAAAADAGTYSVTVTVGGCTSAAGTTGVAIAPRPAQPAASNGGPYCEGSTIALSAPTVAGATYAWTGPNGFTSALQNPTRANAAAADFGTYAVTVAVGGCTSAAGTTTVVDTSAAATATNSGPYCAGDTIALSTPTIGGATYAWTGPNGFTSAQQNPVVPNASAANAGSYSVIVTTADCTSLAGSTNVVVNTAAATPTATNGGPYCTGGTVALFTPTVAGTTYAWTGPNGFTSALQNPTIANATLAAAGTYSVTLFNGCTSSAGTTDVVINAAPAAPTPSNTGPFCAGGTISLSTPAVGGATYAWTGPNGFTSTLPNPTRANASAADAGTYSVTVTVNGCTSPAGTTNVVVTTVPTPSPANGGPYCAGATMALATPIVPGATYSWTGPNGFTSSLPNPTRVNAAVADAGVYSVTVTANGCTSAAGTTSVVVNPIPTAPTASNGGPYCSGGTISLSTAAVAGATYSWTGPNGFTSNLQNPTRANITTADAGAYSVAVTVNGCTSPAGTTNVVVHAVPATPVATNGGPYCTGSTILLSTTAVSGATYSWTGPNGFTASVQNATILNASAANAGTYSVTVTVGGCTSAAGSTTVVLNPTPATPTASNTGPYCAGGTISLSTPTVAGATYAWTGPNGFTSNLQNPTIANAPTYYSGTYSVTITVGGCPSAAGTTNVVVSSVPFATLFNGGPYCAGATISLSAPFFSGATYAWTGPNGFTSTLQNPTISNATTAAAGTYSAIVTVNGCPSSPGTTNVVVNPPPATPTASNGGPYCGGLATVSLFTPTVPGAFYRWTGPNGFFSTAQNPTVFSVTTNGTYSVTVTVNGCTSAPASTNVVVYPALPLPVIGPYSQTTFCPGGSVLLSSNILSGNQWYLNGAPIQGATNLTYLATAAGNYTFVATVNGCTVGPSAPVTVTVLPGPDATIGVSSALGAGIPSTAGVSSAGAGATYSWSITNGTIISGGFTNAINFVTGSFGQTTLNATVFSPASGCADTKSAIITLLPDVSNVTPTAGRVNGGTNITITGSGFQPGATVNISGALATNVVWLNASTLTATTSAHVAGTYDVIVTNPDNRSTTRKNGFSYVAQQFDPNGDSAISPADIFYLVNYIFLSGPVPRGPIGMMSGDANADGKVDPADIFYAVNFLFLSGPAPASAPGSVSAQSAGGALSGSIALGVPVRKGNHYTIPVIVAASPGSPAPQALALRVAFRGGAVRNAAAHTAGGVRALYEIARPAANALSYLLTYDGTPRDGVVAEIELDTAADLRIDVDPSVTMLADRAGMRSATVAAGTLQVSGQTIDRYEPHPPPSAR